MLFYSELYKDTPVFLPTDNLDDTPKLTQSEVEIMSADITVEELKSALNLMRPSSAPENDGLTVKFYIHFWDLIKDDLINCFNHSYLVEKMSSSQRQGKIRLLPRKGVNPLLVSNWRPISLLNVDYKILTQLFTK